MACGVTLKRSLDLDSMMSPETSLKRRRTSVNAGHYVPFRPSSNSPPYQQQQQQQQHSHGSSDIQEGSSSPVTNNGMKISTDELESYLMSELESRRRRRLFHNTAESYFGSGRSSPASAGSSDSECDQQHMMDGQNGAGESSDRDRPLFTYKQVRLICERLLKKQEMHLREEYDQVLNARLAEQYDTFVRFTYDQIHRRIDDSPMTYLS